MPNIRKRVLLGRGKGYLSAAGSQYRFIIFLLIVLGIYTFLLKIFQKLAEIMQLPVFLPVALIILFFFVGVVGTLYSHRSIGPLQRIRAALERMADGETNVSLRLRDSDEPLLKDLVREITRVCEHSRNSHALIHEAARELFKDIASLQEQVRQGADNLEMQKLVDGLCRKQDLLEKAIKAYRKA